MKENRELNDDYLFELFKDEEADKLFGIPDEVPEHNFSPEFEQKMQDIIYSEKKKFKFNRKMIAASLTLILSLGILSGLTNNNIRGAFGNFYKISIKQSGDSYKVRTESYETDEIDMVELVEPSYIPDGYEVNKKQYGRTYKCIIYRNEIVQEIMYAQDILSHKPSIDFSVDMIDTKQYQLTIGDSKIEVFERESGRMSELYWTDRNSLYAIVGWNLDEIVKMAESIINKN